MIKIQLKRGLEKDLPTLSLGEPAFTTDTGKLFVGSPTGNIQIFNSSVLNGIIPNNQGWVSTDGQDTFQISNGQLINIKLLTVYISGIVQPDITLVNNTSFKLPEPLSAGINVFAIWFESAIPVTQGHHSTHELNGQDELDVSRLKNYQELIASPLAKKVSSVNGVAPDLAGNVVISAGNGYDPLVHPESFGALFNGVADDTTAVQNAINSISKGYVLLPNKDIVLKTITMKSNVWLVSNAANIIVPTTAGINVHLFNFNGVTNTGILGAITVNGQRATQTNTYENGQHGIFITNGSTDLYFDNLYIHDMTDDGFYVGQNATSSRIYVNRIVTESCGRNGISLTDVNGIHFNYISTRNNSFGAPKCGLDLEPNTTPNKCDNVSIGFIEAYGNETGISVVTKDATKTIKPNGLKVDWFYTHNNTLQGWLLWDCSNVQANGISELNTRDGMKIRGNVSKIRFNAIFRLNGWGGVMANMTTADQTGGATSYDWNFNGSRFYNNSTSVANTYDGIRVESADSSKVLDYVSAKDCDFYDDQGTHTQRYGFATFGYANNVKVTGRFFGNTGGNYTFDANTKLYFIEIGLYSYTSSVSGTVSANSNLDVDVTLPTGMLSSNTDRLTYSIGSALPTGITATVMRAGTDIARVKLQNTTASPITVNATNFNFVVSKS